MTNIVNLVRQSSTKELSDRELIERYPIQSVEQEELRSSVVGWKLANNGKLLRTEHHKLKRVMDVFLLDLDSLDIKCPTCKTGRHINSVHCQLRYLAKNTKPEQFRGFKNNCTPEYLQEQIGFQLQGLSKRTKLYKVLTDPDVINYMYEILEQNDHNRLCELFAKAEDYSATEFHSEPVAYVRRGPSIRRGNVWTRGRNIWLVLSFMVGYDTFDLYLVQR